MDSQELVQLAALATEVRLLSVKVTEFCTVHRLEHVEIAKVLTDLDNKIGVLELGQERLSSRQGVIVGSLTVFQVIGSAIAAYLGIRK